jgi:hypothetical protein
MHAKPMHLPVRFLTRLGFPEVIPISVVKANVLALVDLAHDMINRPPRNTRGGLRAACPNLSPSPSLSDHANAACYGLTPLWFDPFIV